MTPCSEEKVPPRGGRHPLCLIGLGLFLLAGPFPTGRSAATVAAAQSSDEDAAAARLLIQQLGDERFAVRERAMDRLVALGLPALPALEQGRRHPDREIRYRSERVLSIVKENDFQRRLEAFAADVKGEQDFGLPAWSTFRETFGSSPTARAMFVDMLRAEGSLLQALEEGPREASYMLEVRAVQLQQTQLRSEQISVGSIAALLFMVSRPELSVSAQSSQIVFQACFQGYFHKAISEGSQRATLRRLLGMAIEQAVEWPAYLALQLAMRYDLTEGLTPAVRTLSGKVNNSLPFVRQFAILAVAKFGDLSHRPLLEALLEDPTPCSSLTMDNVRYETQIRDVALASLWKLYDEDPRDHGFGSRVQENSQIVFNTGTLGFAGDTQRNEALRIWREFIAQRKDVEPAEAASKPQDATQPAVKPKQEAETQP